MEVMYSFNATPMSPVGTETFIHVTPICSQSWRYYSIPGWYFEPALNHCRVIKTVTDTGAVILTETLKFKHHAIKTPKFSPTEKIVKATQGLDQTIQTEEMHHPKK